jgi:hypothetical protein
LIPSIPCLKRRVWIGDGRAVRLLPNDLSIRGLGLAVDVPLVASTADGGEDWSWIASRSLGNRRRDW